MFATAGHLDVPPRRKVEFPFHYSTEGRYVHLVARLSDEPGALAMLLAVLGSKVNLVGTTSYTSGDTAFFSGFGKVLADADDAKSIQGHVSESHSVDACQVWEGEEGLLVDNFHHGLQTASGEPYVMLPCTALSSTFESLVKTFGSGGEMILYQQGYNYALARWQVYKRVLGPHPERRFDDLAAIFSSLGWGSSTATISNGQLTYVVEDCFECSVPTESGRTCSFLRGMAVGLTQKVVGKPVECLETACRLKGGKACKFVVSTKDSSPLF